MILKTQAGEAVPTITRRRFLSAAPVAVAAAATPVAAVAMSETPTLNTSPSPALVVAHARLKDALAEQAAAKDALEWLADEWRHRWPLAPEETLGGANGDKGYGKDSGERDIIGRFLFRDTAGLRRFRGKWLKETPRACFCVDTAAELQARLNGWEESKPKGRTAKALLANTARREEMIKSLTRATALAREYEAMTASLREQAGVEAAKLRIVNASRSVNAICAEIADLPAKSFHDLVIKAQGLDASDIIAIDKMATVEGYFGHVGRFIQSAVNLAREV
jgi:hypothetical protein